jgi:AraC family transcriptional regulator
VREAKGAYSFGQELRVCQLDGIRLSETVVPAGLRLGQHMHAPGQICFVLEGEYEECTRDGEQRLTPGALQFHAPGEQHSNVFSSEVDALTLLISIDPGRWIEIAAPRPITPNSILRNCAREIRRELQHADAAAHAAMEAWTMLSLSMLARWSQHVDEGEPEWLKDAMVVIEHRLREPISLRNVAEAVRVHRATLAAAFRRFKKTSVGEWIREQRVREIKHALANRNIPLCELATEVGFHDQAHMGRVFRKATGISPGAYRSLNR